MAIAAALAVLAALAGGWALAGASAGNVGGGLQGSVQPPARLRRPLVLLAGEEAVSALSSHTSAESEVSNHGATVLESEVVGISGSRPAKLLYSEGVQALVSVLTRLKAAPGEKDDTSALTTLLRNVAEAAGEIGDRQIPDSLSDDLDEAWEAAEQLTEDNEWDPRDGRSWRLVLEQFSQLRLARRFPEVADELVPWDTVLPPALSKKAGVEQAEVRSALLACARAVDFQEMASWSEEELEEAFELVERNEVLKEVFASLETAFDDFMQDIVDTAAAVAAIAVLVPVALVLLAVAACASCLAGGGGGSGAPVPSALSPEELGVLPVYKLGFMSKT